MFMKWIKKKTGKSVTFKLSDCCNLKKKKQLGIYREEEEEMRKGKNWCEGDERTNLTFCKKKINFNQSFIPFIVQKQIKKIPALINSQCLRVYRLPCKSLNCSIRLCYPLFTLSVTCSMAIHLDMPVTWSISSLPLAPPLAPSLALPPRWDQGSSTHTYL